MINRPAFRSHLHVEALGAETLFLLSEDRHWALSGRIYVQLAPLIDGRNSVADLITLLAGQVSPPELLFALGRLEARGYIGEADQTSPPGQAAFWDALGPGAARAAQALAAAPLEVRALGAAEAAPLQAALERLGVPAGQGGALVVLTDHYLHTELERINADCLAAGRPWVLVRPAGQTLWVGPAFTPGQTGCWACLAERLRANRQLDSYFQRRSGSPEPFAIPLAALPGSAALAAELAATEIAKWLVRPAQSSLHGQVLSLDQISLETARHQLVRRPQCPACGDPRLRSSFRPPELRPQPRALRVDGGYRSVRPEQTFARYQHHVSPITGAIHWLGDLTAGQNHGLVYSYGASHNFALVQDDAYWVQRNLRSNTGGKGMSELQAKVSAICEAFERYSGVYSGDEPERQASYRELGAAAVHPHDCLNFSPAQYAGRQEWNARSDVARFHSVPNRFDETQPVAWSPLWSLSAETVKYVPAAYCYFGHPDANRFYYCAADGNGNAAGNTLEEAILQGFLELVERDSAAIWWYNQIPRPALDLDSFGLPYLDAIQRHYQSLERDLWVLDITADLGIPTFAAISRRRGPGSEDVLLGLGAHLDPQVALLRAVTELNQFLPAVSRRAPDGRTLYNFPEGEAVTWWTKARVAELPYLAPSPERPRTAADYPSLGSDDLLDDVRRCVAIAGQAGLEVLVLEQTRPDIGMPVVKVIVPGLRHFWRRLGPGRLYDVPVRLGWLDQPRPEQDLNPFSIFF